MADERRAAGHHGTFGNTDHHAFGNRHRPGEAADYSPADDPDANNGEDGRPDWRDGREDRNVELLARNPYEG